MISTSAIRVNATKLGIKHEDMDLETLQQVITLYTDGDYNDINLLP